LSWCAIWPSTAEFRLDWKRFGQRNVCFRRAQAALNVPLGEQPFISPQYLAAVRRAASICARDTGFDLGAAPDAGNQAVSQRTGESV
ncbi:MAG TPA: hypothetical protein VHM01_23050, partial [Alphaproteobacteria bacterium]|nr:hypothetical protein [Alphaproteobacteria bacterium]